MGELEAGFLAARLLGVSVAVLLLPGLALLASLRIAVEWPERIVFAFSLSYSWIFVLSVVVPLFGWTVDHAAVLTLMVIAGAGSVAVANARAGKKTVAPPYEGRAARVAMAAVILACAVGAWVIEPPITGEEALDLASLSRFADGGPVTLENTSLLPDTRPVYLFQPYQLALGMISRWSATEPLIAFVKFRSFLAPLCLVFVYVLLRQLTATRIEAGAAFAVVLMFIALDIGTWERNSLFPFVRRGGVGAGICVPALLVLCLAATRKTRDPDARCLRLVALASAPMMLVASLSTHPLEMFPLLCFIAAMAFTILVGFDRSGDRRQAFALMLLLAVVVGGYFAVHSRAVPYVAEYEHGQQLELRADLSRLVSSPAEAITGMTRSRDILGRSIPATTATVIGIPALALAVLRTPATAAVLTLGIVPLALLYATPAGFVVLSLLTSAATVQEVNAYFALLGLLALALGLVALAQVVLHAASHRRKGFGRVVTVSAVGSVVLWTAWIASGETVRWLGRLAVTRPELYLLVAVVVAAGVLTVAAIRTRPLLASTQFPLGVVVLTSCLAIPLAAPGWLFGGVFEKSDRMTVVTKFRNARTSPSVLDWPAYYEHMRHTIAPPLPVPRVVVDELRRRMPPRQILLAHPGYSCALVALIDAYCINPEFIYGHYFLTAARYHEEYVDSAETERPVHPFFNSQSELSDAERSLLIEYRVSYVLADPEHAEQIDRKLREAKIGAILEMNREGYHLYSISRS